MPPMPPTAPAQPQPLAFGPFVLDLAGAQLLRQGRRVALPPKALAVLAHLASRPGWLASKGELLDAVWGHRHLSASALKTVMSELRAALGDDARSPQWIDTVARRGYRFIGTLATPSPAPPTVPAAATAAALKLSHDAVLGNLPPATPALCGRDDALAEVQSRLATQRLVSLCGPAGIGKTRLALAAAHELAAQFAGGAWWLELAPLPPDIGAPALRATLAQALQAGADAGASNAALAQAWVPRRALLLLDNAEHLLDTLAPIVAGLCAASPRVRVLITSQEPLNIEGETVLRLPPLAVPPEGIEDPERLLAHGAVRLFVQRVVQRLPGFELAADQRQAVAGICRALDGVPLALELAAASVPMLGVDGLLERLQGAKPAAPEGGARLSLLNHGWRGAAPRQRSLREAIAWSHALLTPSQQVVFRRLAVFRGGFEAGAAEAVCTDARLTAHQVLADLAALADKSLLATDASATGTPRHRLLEGPREFADEQLREAGEAAAVADRHARWVAAVFEREEQHELAEPGHLMVQRLAPELDNLRAAWRWCSTRPPLTDVCLTLASCAVAALTRAGQGSEARRWLDHAAGLVAQASAGQRARLDLSLAHLASISMAYTPARALAAAQSAAAVFAAQGDLRHEYQARYLECWMSNRGAAGVDKPAALARLRDLEAAAGDWGPLATRWRRMLEIMEHRLAGRSEAYLQACQLELDMMRRLGAREEAWSVAQWLMLGLGDAGRDAEALTLGTSIVAELRAAGRERQHFVLVVLWLMTWARFAPLSGLPAELRPALAEGAQLLQGLGKGWMLGSALAWCAFHEGRASDAAVLLAHGRGALRRAGENNGPFAQRTADALVAALAERLETESLAAAALRGEALDDSAALQLALGDLAPA